MQGWTEFVALHRQLPFFLQHPQLTLSRHASQAWAWWQKQNLVRLTWMLSCVAVARAKPVFIFRGTE
jgi:hypothetical protein